MDDVADAKPCTRCRRWLPLDEFRITAWTPGGALRGRDSWCRACHAEACRDWRERNPKYVERANAARMGGAVSACLLGVRRRVHVTVPDGDGLARPQPAAALLALRARTTAPAPIHTAAVNARTPARRCMTVMAQVAREELDLVSVKEAARLLGQSVYSIRRKIYRGELFAYRLGDTGPLRIEREEVRRHLRPRAGRPAASTVGAHERTASVDKAVETGQFGHRMGTVRVHLDNEE